MAKLERNLFENTRVRFRRTQDGRTFSGWASKVTTKELYVKLSEVDSLQEGHKLEAEIIGWDRCALFEAVVGKIDELHAYLLVCSGIRYTAPEQEARSQITGFEAIFEIDGNDHPCQIADVSLHGCGIYLATSFEVGKKGILKVCAKSAKINTEASVMNNRMLDTESNSHRIGLKLDFSNRIQRGHWYYLIHGCIDQEAA